jgi:hypothetical protein
MKVCQNSFLYFKHQKLGYLLTTMLLYLQFLLFMQGNLKQALKLVRYCTLSLILKDFIIILHNATPKKIIFRVKHMHLKTMNLIARF